MAGEVDPAQYLSWEFEDAKLTPLGWQQVGSWWAGRVCELHESGIHPSSIVPCMDQARDLGSRLREQPGFVPPEVIVVSPLSRAIETVAGVFGEQEPKFGHSDRAANRTSVQEVWQGVCRLRSAAALHMLGFLCNYFDISACDMQQLCGSVL